MHCCLGLTFRYMYVTTENVKKVIFHVIENIPFAKTRYNTSRFSGFELKD